VVPGRGRLQPRAAPAIGYGRRVAGSRVLIRAPTLADEAEWIARMRASRRVHRPWIRMPLTPEAYRDYVARNADDRRAQRIVCRLEDGALVGFINVSEIIRGSLSSAFLGYGGVAEFAGRGYMSEGMQLVLREAFSTLRLHRLEANIQPGNLSSIALAERAGFVREGFSERYLKVGGRWRDHERWAIRAEQWRAR
jgi:ribosomal-protein-alanine N-acetyltransferase